MLSVAMGFVGTVTHVCGWVLGAQLTCPSGRKRRGCAENLPRRAAKAKGACRFSRLLGMTLEGAGTQGEDGRGGEEGEG